MQSVADSLYNRRHVCLYSHQNYQIVIIKLLICKRISECVIFVVANNLCYCSIIITPIFIMFMAMANFSNGKLPLTQKCQQ